MAEPPCPFEHALFSVAQLRALEAAASQNLASTPLESTLMQRAGQAAAQLALALLQDARKPGGLARARPAVLILAGPGNNGGDGLAMVSPLCDAGMDVSVVLLAQAQRMPADARAAFEQARASTACFHDSEQATALLEQRWDLIVDALFGIGLARPLDDEFRALVDCLNARGKSGQAARKPGAASASPVLALDVPSGLDADTGNAVGQEGLAVIATHTITFLGNKPGLHTAAGRDYAGTVSVAGLDVRPSLYQTPVARLSSPQLFDHARKPRRHASHKGSYGDVTVIGGAAGMAGAVILAARAAAFCGAGKVFAGFIDGAPAFDPGHPELMCRPASALSLGKGCIVAGTGMGESARAAALLKKILATPGALVLDADALNLIAQKPALRNLLAARPAPALLTPHPLEAARLLGVEASAVQADRLKAAGALATRLHAVVILKGSGTVIAFPDGALLVNTTGNAGLATAGSGDVLSGICGALLAQSWPLREAAAAAVWLHGRAADRLVAAGTGPVGMTAAELILPVRALLNEERPLA